MFDSSFPQSSFKPLGAGVGHHVSLEVAFVVAPEGVRDGGPEVPECKDTFNIVAFQFLSTKSLISGNKLELYMGNLRLWW
jgi:hypothetical protein